MTDQQIETFINSIKYYNKKFDKYCGIPIPKNIEIHHYILTILTTIIEVHINTFFILPILSLSITQYLFIKNEHKNRTLGYCINYEEEHLSKLESKYGYDDPDYILDDERDEWFISLYKSASDTGFLYSRGVLLLKSVTLIFLIYFATTGIEEFFYLV